MSRIKKEIQKKESSKAIILREEQYLEWCYNMFITLITLFPLLGMFGTVAALLSLDLTGEIEQIKGNFFNALTSTAWGIVFSVLFGSYMREEAEMTSSHCFSFIRSILFQSGIPSSHPFFSIEI